MYAPDVRTLIHSECSPLQDVLIWFLTDEKGLFRRYPIPFSPTTCREAVVFYDEWDRQLDKIDFDGLSAAGRIDYHLLRRKIKVGRLRQEDQRVKYEEVLPWLPFAEMVIDLEEKRIAIEKTDAKEAARRIHEACHAIKEKKDSLKDSGLDAQTASRTAHIAEELKKQIENWHRERFGYDPMIAWWVEKPYADFIETLDGYVKTLKEDVAGEKDEAPSPILNKPLGRDYIVEALETEVVAYSPEELLEIAEKELAWCEKEMEKVSAKLGYPNDRDGAIEHIKNLHVEPGEQPYVAKRLAEEAVAYLEKNDLITLPDFALRMWRQSMISPEMQKSYPFLYGGEVIGTSFSHKEMSHERKLTSMRSNNLAFMMATVHHELIPGHHLQIYMGQRKNTHRQGYGTPFCGEGWPLYWELFFYEDGLPQEASDRLGFLFWRMHRCARVMVVLGFHIGRMSIQDSLDLIIGRVGHEVEGGTSQVRWLTSGGASPLYGAAYMLGALQLRGLRKELVDSGKMTNREFHDRIMAENSMPIELLRAAMTGKKLAKDHKPEWRFYEGLR